MGNHNKGQHHRGPHQRISRHVTAWANANPDAICADCHRTINHCGPRGDGRNRNGTPCTWDAGHITIGDPTAGYKLVCSHCNRSEGARHINAQRRRDRHTPW